MYQRLDIDTIQELHKEYAKDRLFQNLYSAISAVCTKTDDITAEEIWKLASEYVRQIVQTENDLFEIDALPSKLYHLLSKYQEGTTVVIRSKEDIERTVFFVELVMLYQLTRYQREGDGHPYENYCLALIGQIQQHPLLEKIIPMIKETNDRYEPVYGGELEHHDYIPFVIKIDSGIIELVQVSDAVEEYMT